MTSNNKYVLSGPDVVCEEFDGEFVVLDLKTGCYFSFNRSASVVWNLLAAGVAPSAIEAAWGKAIQPLLDTLLRHDLLVASGEAGEIVLDADARASLRAVEDAPTVEAFEDLADLIRADPVHDVDEAAGWPQQNKAVSS